MPSACREMERVGVALEKAHASGPKNSPLLFFFCNLQAGKGEDIKPLNLSPSPVSITQFINVK